MIGALALILASALALRAQDFPLTIETRFGPTVIEAPPERVASLDYNGADNLLALGIQPVTIRDWYGDHPRALWPWADPLLTGTPTILRGVLDFEAIAATDPDVIIALWSGITAEEHTRLSLIAPVVAVPEGVGDFALAWQAQVAIMARAVGREAEAAAQVAAIGERLAAAANPDWQGRTAAVAFAWEADGPGAYTSSDIRPQLLADLGFVTPPAIDALATGANAFAITMSPEDLSPIDGDLIVWITTDDAYPHVLSLAARPFLTAVQEGREVFTDTELGSAFSHSTLLSLPYAIDRLVPMIEAALDGDPATHADDRPHD
ncbi:MAG: ABC transporter substrate-binding protein [Rubellimicrobium sp.]|nr:ABC transporter substrate-binding protein [Rubellimicrobium sp.]